MKIYHISLTGINAGRLVCGQIAKENEVKAHPGKWMDNPELEKCAECFKLWNEETEENDDIDNAENDKFKVKNGWE